MNAPIVATHAVAQLRKALEGFRSAGSHLRSAVIYCQETPGASDGADAGVYLEMLVASTSDLEARVSRLLSIGEKAIPNRRHEARP